MAVSQTNAKYPAPIIFGAQGDALDRELIVREAVWTGIGTSGDDIVISDYDSTASLYIGKGYANVDQYIDVLRGQRVDGIKLTILDSGQLLIYL